MLLSLFYNLNAKRSLKGEIKIQEYFNIIINEVTEK